MSPLLLLCLIQASVAETQVTEFQALPQTWADLWPFLQTISLQALDFLSGVLIGLQANLALYSPCVLSYLALAPHWALFLQVAESAWLDGKLERAFDVLQTADEFLSAVVSSGQRCQIWLLMERLAEIFTLSGFLYYAGVAYLNQQFLAVSTT